MRTNIELDDALISEARRLVGLRTKRETVDAALKEFVSRRRQQDVLALAGQAPIASDHDVRASRARMNKR